MYVRKLFSGSWLIISMKDTRRIVVSAGKLRQDQEVMLSLLLTEKQEVSPLVLCIMRF